MNRFCKVLAVVLAMLMLVTMATACKKSDDDEFSAFLDGAESSDNGFNNEDGTGDTGDTNQGGDTTDDKDSAKDPSSDKGNADSGNKNPSGSDKDSQGAVTNNADANEKEQDKVVDNYEGTMKFDFANNPLFAKSKPINHGEEPSFDIDTTGFVKNVKVKDLKGKTMTAITSLEEPNFIYRGSKGEKLNEWTWFESLKKTYGVNFKYIESRWDKAPSLILTYMNTGKQLDIIPTHRSALAMLMNLSQPLDSYINMKYVNNSPGVDTRTMEQSKRHDGYRCIAPIGAVDVIWYNATMTKDLGLKDPYTLWKQNKWDWEAYKNYILSVPETAPNGNTKLQVFFQSAGDSIFFWPRTNGVNVFDFKVGKDKTEIISNFNDDRCLSAWTFYSDLMNQADYKNRNTEGGSGGVGMWEQGSAIMGCTLYLMKDWSSSDFACSQQFRWVPYPKGPGKGGECVAMNYGNTMMLPKIMKNKSNIPYAIKVMEIWANRFTEAINDYLQEPYFNFTHEERVEFFNFVSQHNYFNPAGGWRNLLSGDDYTYYKEFEKSFYDNTKYNTTTAAKQVSNIIGKAVGLMNTYGD
ncbi:MAG: hypothetical protein IKK30_01305 [Clostridia bacterium]|nr:hypothetical protein [Clostridia bacterium]